MKNITRKILASHTDGALPEAGEEISLRVDQAYIEDHSGVKVMQRFAGLGLDRVKCVVAACYFCHELLQNPEEMREHIFLQKACKKYGMWLSRKAAGICHQLHVENFAIPGAVILGANSHTPHCGGIGAMAFGTGGSDLTAALAGIPYTIAMPRIVNVRVKGRLNTWCAAKDAGLELIRRIGTGGGRGKIFEFTGDGISNLTVQERMVITNLCTEMGAMTGIFPSDAVTRGYFRSIGRENDWVGIMPDSGAAYDDEMELDLSSIEPLVAFPHQPDNVMPVEKATGISVGQIMAGSCTGGFFGRSFRYRQYYRRVPR